MISKSASRRKRREHMKNPTWQERMVYQRNVGRVHQLPMEIVRRQEPPAPPPRHEAFSPDQGPEGPVRPGHDGSLRQRSGPTVRHGVAVAARIHRAADYVPPPDEMWGNI